MGRLFQLLVIASILASAPAAAKIPPIVPLTDPTLPFTKVVLRNGLVLIVQEDHKAPVVAVNLWYHVGSKDEPPGRTGFAHLFEHLMFGSTNGNQRGWFERLEAVGATDINGTTANDRTNFFETVPTPALDMTLAMEAGRMGHLLDSFNEGLLTTQRGVVQNEKRQDENQPYAISEEVITKSVWPAAHPYSHTVIGEMTDLDAAKVEDVRDWYHKYYGPANATLVLAGDITPTEAQIKVEKYFGAIPPGPPVLHQKEWVAKRTGDQRASVQDHVPQARLYVEWNTPPRDSADAVSLDLLADVLAVGKGSRLYRRLVYQDQIATDVTAYNDDREIGSLLDVELTAKDGVPLARLESAFHEELDRVLKDGPTASELDRAKTRRLADFIRRTERVGGFGGKSDLLAEYQTYGGDPGAWRTSLELVRAATPRSVSDAGRRWLSDGAFTLELTPFPDYAALSGAAPTTTIPASGPALAPRFPKVSTAVLSNGLKIVVAERHDVPTVSFDLAVNAGGVTNPVGLAGLAALDGATMLDGTVDLDALEFDNRKAALGVTLDVTVGRDSAQVLMSALSSRLDPSLDLLSDVVIHPAFRPADLQREQALSIANIQQTKQDPISEALRLSEALVYGPDNPYGRVATEASVSRATVEDLRRHHQMWFQPLGATLIVVGDTTLTAIVPKLEAKFGTWKTDEAGAPIIPPSPNTKPSSGTVFVVDKPGALQSVISASGVAPPKLNPDDIAIQAMITSLGGAFTSRLNMNLREDKHWAYGAFAFVQDARGPSLFTVLAPVQSDKTKESYGEVQRELRDIVGAKPLTARELELAQHNLILSLPGQWETNKAVARALAEISVYGLPLNYYEDFSQHVNDLRNADVQRAAAEIVAPGALTWIVVGDRSVVTKPLQSLGLNVVAVNSDGVSIQ